MPVTPFRKASSGHQSPQFCPTQPFRFVTKYFWGVLHHFTCENSSYPQRTDTSLSLWPVNGFHLLDIDPNKSFPRQHCHIASQTQSSSVILRRTSVSPYKPFDQEERSGGHKRQGLVMSHSSTGWSPNWRHTPTSSNRPSKATVRPVLPVPPYDGGDDYRIFHCLVLEEPSTIECLRGQATLPSVR